MAFWVRMHLQGTLTYSHVAVSRHLRGLKLHWHRIFPVELGKSTSYTISHGLTEWQVPYHLHIGCGPYFLKLRQQNGKSGISTPELKIGRVQLSRCISDREKLHRARVRVVPCYPAVSSADPGHKIGFLVAQADTKPFYSTPGDIVVYKQRLMCSRPIRMVRQKHWKFTNKRRPRTVVR